MQERAVREMHERAQNLVSVLLVACAMTVSSQTQDIAAVRIPPPPPPAMAPFARSQQLPPHQQQPEHEHEEADALIDGRSTASSGRSLPAVAADAAATDSVHLAPVGANPFAESLRRPERDSRDSHRDKRREDSRYASVFGGGGGGGSGFGGTRTSVGSSSSSSVNGFSATTNSNGVDSKRSSKHRAPPAWSASAIADAAPTERAERAERSATTGSRGTSTGPRNPLATEPATAQQRRVREVPARDLAHRDPVQSPSAWAKSAPRWRAPGDD